MLTTEDIGTCGSKKLELKKTFNNYRYLRCSLCLRRLLLMLNCNFTPVRTNEISSSGLLVATLFHFILYSTKVGGGGGLNLPSPSPCAVPVNFYVLKVPDCYFFNNCCNVFLPQGQSQTYPEEEDRRKPVPFEILDKCISP